MKKTAMQKLKEENMGLRRALLQVAKLAADEPMFFNPLHAMDAKRVRDYVLANQEEYL